LRVFFAGEVKKAKQTYFIQRIDGQPIAFAGLMSRRTVEGDKSEFTCTILT
jgi:putative SOS response-associated peptidase YedK